MDSDELIGYGHTPKWVQDQGARMNEPQPGHATLDLAWLPLSELGMYGQSLGGDFSWCLCSLCQKPVGGPAPEYTREQAKNDLARHLVESHGAEPNT